MRAPQGQEFFFCNGKVAATVEELKAEIPNLTKEEFGHHVNKEKNDFYNWIYNCIDQKIAVKVKNVKTQKTFVSKLK